MDSSEHAPSRLQPLVRRSPGRDTFAELANHRRQNVLTRSHVVEEEPPRELLPPAEATTRLCFLALPLSAHPFSRERVSPALRQAGLVPLTADQVMSPGDAVVAKIDALISRPFLVAIDTSSDSTLTEAQCNLVRQLALYREFSGGPIGGPTIQVVKKPLKTKT